MPGRRIPDERDFHTAIGGLTGADGARRRQILRETLQAFSDAVPPNRYTRLAMENVRRWREQCTHSTTVGDAMVLPGDWGEVTLSLTRKHGVCFAVLNMANAYVPGGGYVEGAPAQEENMFRRTDCHFYIGEDEYDAKADRYVPEATQLLSARQGRVYLDTKQPRICIRGPEDRSQPDLGYPWLPEDQVFPFFELRAAAQDLRDGSRFDADEARRRIAAQLDTLKRQGVRHAVLSAFGCGAFRNPAHEVARIYKDEIGKRTNHFSVIAFAIFAPGYGPDNYATFADVFSADC